MSLKVKLTSTIIAFMLILGLTIMGVFAAPTYLISADKSITSCEISPECKLITDYTFAANNFLVSVVIPKSVTSIGLSAFQTCALTIINYTGTEEEWNAIAIGETNTGLSNENLIINYNYQG